MELNCSMRGMNCISTVLFYEINEMEIMQCCLSPGIFIDLICLSTWYNLTGIICNLTGQIGII